MTTTADIVVIGGGCMGTSIAWQLARRGAGRVVLVEREAIAAGASGWTGAIVRTHYTHPVLVRMALRSLRVFQEFPSLVGGPPVFHRTGFLVLVGPDDADALAANVAMQREQGVEARCLSVADAQAVEPRLALDGVAAVAWEPDSGYVDAPEATAAFADAARRAGVDIRVGRPVTGLLASGGRLQGVGVGDETIATRTVVVAAGYRTRDLAATVGVDVPLTPVRHDIALVERAAAFGPLHPVISDRVLGFFCRPDGQRARVGTTAPYDGAIDPNVEGHAPPTAHEAERLTDGYRRRFPSAHAVHVGGFSCAYDCSPDLQPILGAVDGVAGLVLATGFSGHGFKLSPVIGELLAERILTGAPAAFDLDLFNLRRFALGAPIGSERPYTVATLG